MGDASGPGGHGGEEWEICNDGGFVYKRRRRGQPTDAPPPPPAEHSEAEMRRHGRERRRCCLLDIMDRDRRELEQWERLSTAQRDLASPPPSVAATSSSNPELPSAAQVEAPSPGEQELLIDELLSLVEGQEAMLQKQLSFCDEAESLCREKEESLAESLMELPIWGSPRTELEDIVHKHMQFLELFIAGDAPSLK